jgi:hypothetical protein
VLAAFYKLRGVEQPADEVEAWERMKEILEAPEVPEPAKVVTGLPEETDEGVKPKEPKQIPESNVEDVKEETPPAPAVSPEEPTPQPTPEPAQEAPEPERKACVQIPVSSLVSLRERIAKVRDDAIAKASRDGLPTSEWADIAEAAVRQFQASLSNP